MGQFGTMVLLLAAVFSTYAAAGSVAGARLRIAELVRSARRAVYLTFGLLAVATATLVTAFLQHDFSLKYVAANSSTTMPPQYVWVAFYAGNEGSLLFIGVVMAALTAVAVRFAPRRTRPALPYTAAVLAVVQLFFIAVMLVMANPFASLARPPLEGQGINPLLSHPGMFFHPPSLMTGLAMVSIPFAFATGALLSGRVGDEWLGAGRVWAMAAWLVLGLGNLFGSWWAYTILGWGGYWGWDPVENAGLMPWLALTALVHSLMVQKRRGMFRMWNIALIDIAFVLSAYGMFINRGGPVPSVHSFAASAMGFTFLGFLGGAIVLSLGVFFWRYDRLKSDEQLESTFSRESAFLVNNLLLLAIAFVTMWGGLFPILSNVLWNREVTVGAPFYNQVNGPLVLALLFLMGVAPLLPWRAATLPAVVRATRVPLLAGVGTVVALVIGGVRVPYALVSFGIIGFTMGGILAEWWRGTRVRVRRGENPAMAFFRLIAANRPRYGGYIVHVAILMLALGVTGSSFYSTRRDLTLLPGQSAPVGGYTLTYVGPERRSFADRIESVAVVRVSRGSRDLGTLEPWRARYFDQSISPTKAAIRSTWLEDLYVIPSDFLEGGGAVFRVFVNPLVWWLWYAGPIFLVGTAVSLWPTRRAPMTVQPAGPVRVTPTGPATPADRVGGSVADHATGGE